MAPHNVLTQISSAWSATAGDLVSLARILALLVLVVCGFHRRVSDPIDELSGEHPKSNL